MRLVDLTRPLDPGMRERIPEPARGAAVVIAPTVKPLHPTMNPTETMCMAFGCTKDDLPDGEGWYDEKLIMGSHMGTHVDAPLHYGPMCEGKPSRTISDIALEELLVPGMVLDVADKVQRGEGISVQVLEEALEEVGVDVPQGGAVMLRTGQGPITPDDLSYYFYPGMTRESTLWLAEKGAKVLGTDAVGWDRPIPVMVQAWKESGDTSHIWDGHFAGREREVFIVQQLTGLEELPSHGFTVGFFTLPITGVSASPARVVAFLDGEPGAVG